MNLHSRKVYNIEMGSLDHLHLQRGQAKFKSPLTESIMLAGRPADDRHAVGQQIELAPLTISKQHIRWRQRTRCKGVSFEPFSSEQPCFVILVSGALFRLRICRAAQLYW